MPKTIDEPTQIFRGPVDTVRFGKTLLIDLAAPQQSLVVERGSVIPRASLVVTTCAREIITMSKEGVKVETIAVIGSEQDPALHPDLREITENIRALRDKWFQRSKLRVFTRTRDVSAYDLRATLAMYDRIHMQFEWGTAKLFTALTGEKGTALTDLVKNASSFDHLIVEANFFKGGADNSSDGEVKNWIKKLADLKPQEVHILSGNGSAASVDKVKPATKARREQIAEEVAEKTGLQVSTHENETLFA